MRKKELPAKQVRVIPDGRDGSKDYWLDEHEALRLYDEGKLWRDVTNSKPGTPVYCPTS